MVSTSMVVFVPPPMNCSTVRTPSRVVAQSPGVASVVAHSLILLSTEMMLKLPFCETLCETPNVTSLAAAICCRSMVSKPFLLAASEVEPS